MSERLGFLNISLSELWARLFGRKKTAADNPGFLRVVLSRNPVITVDGVKLRCVKSVRIEMAAEDPAPRLHMECIGGAVTADWRVEDLSPLAIAKLRWLVSGAGSVVDRVEED